MRYEAFRFITSAVLPECQVRGQYTVCSKSVTEKHGRETHTMVPEAIVRSFGRSSNNSLQSFDAPKNMGYRPRNPSTKQP